MSAFKIYLFLIAIPMFGQFIVFLGAATMLCAFIFGIVKCDDSKYAKKEREESSWRAFIVILLGLFVLGLGLLFPSKKDMAVIVGGSYLSNIKNIESVPPNLVKKLNEILTENEVKQ